MTRRAVHLALQAVLGIGLLSYAIIVFAHEGGITGLTRKNPDPNQRGCTCHGGTPSSNVSVLIVGPDTLSVGQTGLFTVVISGGPAVKGGTNIAASAGSLVPTSSSLQLFQGELTHTAPQSFLSSGQLNFPFAYTAPSSPGVQTLYANGNSTNGNGNPLGDQWNFAPDKRITVVNSPTTVSQSSGPLPTSFQLLQNYPNPFNPSTTIAYELPTRTHVLIEVFDLSGKKIATLVDGVRSAGRHEVEFLAPLGLSSGTYLYRMTTETSVERKRMTLLK
jgi:hypothetical protein